MNQLLKLGAKQALKNSGSGDSSGGGRIISVFVYLVFGFCTFFIGLGIRNIIIEIGKYLNEIKSSKKKSMAKNLNKAKVTHKENHEFTGVGLILGFLFPYYMWAISCESVIAFVIIGLCFIFVITFAVIALIGELKKTKSDERDFKGPIRVIIGTLLVATLVGLCYRIRTMPIK